jgi:hypothetical protein
VAGTLGDHEREIRLAHDCDLARQVPGEPDYGLAHNPRRGHGSREHRRDPSGIPERGTAATAVLVENDQLVPASRERAQQSPIPPPPMTATRL